MSASGLEAAPDGTALVIIDMINPLDFDGAELLEPHAHKAAKAIGGLRQAADKRRAPVIYVNDNYGHWRDDRSTLLEAHLKPGSRAHGLAAHVHPRDQDFFIVKPQFSGFYATNLPVLLPKLGVTRLILTGVATDICVLFTAADAHMRAYELWVPSDAVASEDLDRSTWALQVMKNSMAAEIRPTGELTLDAWVEGASTATPPARSRLHA